MRRNLSVLFSNLSDDDTEPPSDDGTEVMSDVGSDDFDYDVEMKNDPIVETDIVMVDRTPNNNSNNNNNNSNNNDDEMDQKDYYEHKGDPRLSHSIKKPQKIKIKIEELTPPPPKIKHDHVCLLQIYDLNLPVIYNMKRLIYYGTPQMISMMIEKLKRMQTIVNDNLLSEMCCKAYIGKLNSLDAYSGLHGFRPPLKVHSNVYALDQDQINAEVNQYLAYHGENTQAASLIINILKYFFLDSLIPNIISNYSFYFNVHVRGSLIQLSTSAVDPLVGANLNQILLSNYALSSINNNPSFTNNPIPNPNISVSNDDESINILGINNVQPIGSSINNPIDLTSDSNEEINVSAPNGDEFVDQNGEGYQSDDLVNNSEI